MHEITKIYVGAFAENGLTEKTEVIYAGIYLTDSGLQIARATVETHESAVPNLIKLCKEIAEEKGLEWRLLLFDENGITELDKTIYNEWTNFVVKRK